MNITQLTKVLTKICLPDFFNKKGKLAYYSVSENDYIILIGIYLNRTIDEESFLVEYFIQPLFFPFHTFTFSFGERIGSYWKKGDVTKIEKELSQLKQLTSFDEIANIIETRFSGVTRGYFHQCLCFINYIQGNIDKAKLEINKLIIEDERGIPKWREDEIQKSKEILELIDRGELGICLRNWQQSTIKDLRMDKQFSV
jgi:hypothetical protein